MTLCLLAIVVGCQKCPIVALCPLKAVIGDHRKLEETPPPAVTEPPVKREQ